jgi:UDP-glucose 4-epimerase
MFGIKSYVFRFGNVVGPRQTHGVTYDFVKQLKSGNGVLKVLGNGTQSKTYVHVTDVCKAIFKVLEVGVSENFSIHNVGSDSYITVKEIADLTIEKFNLLNKANISALYQETDRGWNGDVPVMRMSTAKIRKLGWDPKYTSSEALQDSINWLINNDF